MELDQEEMLMPYVCKSYLPVLPTAIYQPAEGAQDMTLYSEHCPLPHQSASGMCAPLDLRMSQPSLSDHLHLEHTAKKII